MMTSLSLISTCYWVKSGNTQPALFCIQQIYNTRKCLKILNYLFQLFNVIIFQFYLSICKLLKILKFFQFFSCVLHFNEKLFLFFCLVFNLLNKLFLLVLPEGIYNVCHYGSTSSYHSNKILQELKERLLPRP